jgi:hypothetical protein
MSTDEVNQALAISLAVKRGAVVESQHAKGPPDSNFDAQLFDLFDWRLDLTDETTATTGLQ